MNSETSGVAGEAPEYLNRKLAEQARVHTRAHANRGDYSRIDDTRARYAAEGNVAVVEAIDLELRHIETDEEIRNRPMSSSKRVTITVIVLVIGFWVIGGFGLVEDLIRGLFS